MPCGLAGRGDLVVGTSGKGIPRADCFCVTFFFASAKMEIMTCVPRKVSKAPVIPTLQGKPWVAGSLTGSKGWWQLELWDSPPEAVSCFLKSSHSSGLLYWVCKAFTAFVRFSLKHIIVLVDIVLGIVFKFQFPVVPCNFVETQWVVLYSSCILPSCLNHLLVLVAFSRIPINFLHGQQCCLQIKTVLFLPFTSGCVLFIFLVIEMWNWTSLSCPWSLGEFFSVFHH